jgi:hypothetical protein
LQEKPCQLLTNTLAYRLFKEHENSVILRTIIELFRTILNADSVGNTLLK